MRKGEGFSLVRENEAKKREKSIPWARKIVPVGYCRFGNSVVEVVCTCIDQIGLIRDEEHKGQMRLANGSNDSIMFVWPSE